MPDIKSEKWEQVLNILQERFGKKPDMEGILFLVGINELAPVRQQDRKFSKEQKQELMHVGVCKLLSLKGYFRFIGMDDDGWPHFDALETPEAEGLNSQELLLKECIIEYFCN